MPAYYNPEPLRRMIRKAANRRIDICGLWNSEGLQGGTGWDTAIQKAVGVDRFGVYATGCHSFCEGDGASGAGVGYWDTADYSKQISTTANGTLFTYGDARILTAPALQLQHLDWSAAPAGSFGPVKPLHIASGDSNNTPTGLSVGEGTPSTAPIPPGEAITWTWWGANWGGTGGSFAPILRRADSPYTSLATIGTINYTGTSGTILKSEYAQAADSSRTYPTAFRTHASVAATMVGPLFLTYMRACRTNRTRGVAVTPFYSAGGRSAYDMHAALTSLSDQSWYHLFDALTTYQGSDLAEHCVIFDVYEGSNQANETGVSASAPQPGDADHPDNYVWYIQQIIIHIQGLWNLSGRSSNNLVFRVSCSHPINDVGVEAECAAYRAALLAQMDFNTFPTVTILDRTKVASLSAMLSAGDFSDTVHLTDAGYIRTEGKAWDYLLNTGGGRSRSRGRVLGGAR